MLRNVDPFVSRLHRLIRPLFSKGGQLLVGTVSLLGLLLFLKDLTLKWSQVNFPRIPNIALTLAVLLVLSGLIHEAGHALATKAFGRKVLGIGIGWNWISPILFVDTSDMWLARRWQRIVVSLAGPYTHLVLGGIASCLSLIFLGSDAQTILHFFTAGSYLLFLMNLLPILNFDGHYVWRELRERGKKKSIFSNVVP
jgi:putative peptide zinc metalloprotease protein